MSDDKKYMFGKECRDEETVGGKGANLAEMTRLNLPVPPGFIVTTEACNDYYRRGNPLRSAQNASS